jgi:DNA adenine methylase
MATSENSTGQNTPAQDWANYPNHIESFTERLKGVVVENKDAIEVLKQHDSIDTLHYVDPPYVHATRNMRRGNAAYAFEMDDQQHVELSEVLQDLKGMVIVSGYQCDLYDRLFKNWCRVQRTALADGAKKRIECLWLNQRAKSQQNRLELF